jgi:hypothetical protein
MKPDQEAYWLVFMKELKGKTYHGQVIGPEPIRAVSFESAYRMVAEGKAIQAQAPNKAKEQE